MGMLQAGVSLVPFHAPERRRAAIELSVLGSLSGGFLALFPRRPIVVDLGLALFALSLVLLSAGHTRARFWGQCSVQGRRTGRDSLLVTMALTLLVILCFGLTGGVIGYQGADWPGVKARLLHPYIPTAILLYVPWAFLQQTLFQFYLLGRVRALWPFLPPVAHSALNGMIFGLVHTADIWIALPAALGGTLWSYLYLRDRRLWPLALSHALIGTTFYYWVYGYDLAGRWSGFFRSLMS
ncbi:MAG TPA: CPBP family intramembrane glutamic endopeptidase [Nitrospiraceae bacterium]|nr:CPBP family intramembrane glutamic endopeptidase [Nitrospiraceae bacterium]